MIAFLPRGLAVSRHSSFVPKNTQCLRRRQKLVQEFCEGVKIPYLLYGFGLAVQSEVGGSEKAGCYSGRCQRNVAERSDIFQIPGSVFHFQ
jgi:hypothetical protein